MVSTSDHAEGLETLAASCTDLERRFAEAYVGEAASNASRAAELAGYAGRPNKTGPRVLARPHVKALVALLQRRAVANFVEHTPEGRALAERERTRALATDQHAELAERVLEELSAVGFSDITDVVRWQSTGEGIVISFRDSADLPPVVRRSIASLTKTIRPDGTIEMKLTMHPKVAALQSLMKITGQAAPEKTDLNVHGDAVVVMYPQNGREAALEEHGGGR